MPRYIDADVLYGKLYPLDLVDKKLYTINAKAVADAIAKTPAADVVEVVRCAHCQHLLKETVVEPTPYGFENEKTSFGCKRALDLTGEWVDVMLDDFCSYGERKE